MAYKMKGFSGHGNESPLKQKKNPSVNVRSKKRVVGDIYDDEHAAKHNLDKMSYTDEYAKKVKKDMLSNKNISKSDRKKYSKQKEIIQTYRHQQRNVKSGAYTTKGLGNRE